ncbi:hypothetical protein PMAYCL1PPCAC_17305, partial [Pristionchus mayeri]
TFLYVNRAGKQQQVELLEMYRSYSVSYRWQLQNNIDVAKNLSILMIIVNITISIVLPCIFGFVTAIVFLSIPKHREWLRGKKNGATSGERYATRVENLTVDAHISQLENAWNAKLDRK